MKSLKELISKKKVLLDREAEEGKAKAAEKLPKVIRKLSKKPLHRYSTNDKYLLEAAKEYGLAISEWTTGGSSGSWISIPDKQ